MTKPLSTLRKGGIATGVQGLGVQSKSSILALATISILVGCLFPTPSQAAETVLGDQILKSDLVLTPSGSPYKLTGLVQIPKEFRLLIQPGVTLIRDGGTFYSEREIVIGSLNGPATVVEATCNENNNSKIFLLGGAPLIIQNSEFRLESNCRNVTPLLASPRELDIQNSILDSWFIQILEDQKLTLLNNIFKSKPSFERSFQFTVITSEIVDKRIENNLFVNYTLAEFEYRGAGKSSKFEGNYFYNDDVDFVFSIDVVRRSVNISVKNNTFPDKSRISEFRFYELPTSSNVQNSNLDYSSNSWPGFKSEQDFRSVLKIEDRVSIIAHKIKVDLDPMLLSPGKLNAKSDAYILAIQKDKAEKEQIRANELRQIELAAQEKALSLKRVQDIKTLSVDFGILAESVTMNIIPRVSSDKDLRLSANNLRSLIINSRDEMMSKSQEGSKADAFPSFYAGWTQKLKSLRDQYLALEARSTKSVTITCIKGKLIKKVTSVMPKCPSGYKVKK